MLVHKNLLVVSELVLGSGYLAIHIKPPFVHFQFLATMKPS